MIDSSRCPPVVAIGASAGGLPALQALFARVPDGLPCAWVVVQHLSPDFKSMLADILGRQTSLPLVPVDREMPLEPGTIYLNTAHRALTLADGRFLLHEPDDEPVHLQRPIDRFMESAAAALGKRAIAVILSGTGHDGTGGLRAVSALGGLTFVQTPDEAQFDGMPRSALDTGLANFSVSAGDIPGLIERHLSAPFPLETRVGYQGLSGELAPVLTTLQSRFGLDFTRYKPATIERRVARRMMQADIATVEAYAEHLKRNPEELEQLHADLLIGVTDFFRDPEAFHRLEETLRVVGETRDRDEEFRVWVTGCSTGQEAYSLAMLLAEQSDAFPRFRVFATDVHRQAVSLASAGLYDAEQLQSVAPDRQERFFVRERDRFRVAPALRHRLVFAPHDLLADAPFTRMDLVTCRNTLIYFRPDVQQRTLEVLLLALKPDGLLLLGPSESPGLVLPCFEPVDAHWRLFQRNGQVPKRSSGFAHVSPIPAGASPARANVTYLARSTGIERAYDLLLSRYAPAGVLLDEHYEVVHVFGDGANFLRFRAGRPSSRIFSLLPASTEAPLRSMLERARQEGQTSVRHVELPGEPPLRVQVNRVVGGSLNWFLVQLGAVPDSQELLHPEPASTGGESDDMLRLRDELDLARESLAITTQEAAAGTEELQSANEELVASNEELQSMNEELQSVNEELYTVNSELQAKIGELQSLTQDMENLIASTRVGTMFVDADLRVRWYSGTATEGFHILPRDIGRPLEHVRHRLDVPNLMDLVHRVRDDHVDFSVRARNDAGRDYRVRLLPYHRQDGAADGVVITLEDVTEMAASERALAERTGTLQALFDSLPHPVFFTDARGHVMHVNAAMTRATGLSQRHAEGQGWLERVHPDDQVSAGAVMARGRPEPVVIRMSSGRHPGYRHYRFNSAPIQSDEDRDVGRLALAEDITDDRMHADIFEQVPTGVLVWEFESPTDAFSARVYRANPAVGVHTGTGRRQLSGLTLEEAFPELVDTDFPNILTRVLHSGVSEEWAFDHLDSAGAPRSGAIRAFPLPGGRVGVSYENVTERQMAREQLDESTTELAASVARLRRTNKELEQFAWITAHDLKEPLRMVTSFLGLLNEEYGHVFDARGREYVDYAVEGGLRAERLIADLLSLARAKRPEQPPAAVPLADLVAEALKQLGDRVTATDASLVAEDLPVVVCYEGLMVQAFRNLFSNAIKFRSNAPPVIRVSARRDNNRFIVEVRDNGIGFDPVHAERIFRIFQRLHAHGTYDGTGIGLAVVRRIIHLHEGTISAHSTPGRGTTFTIELPA